MGRFRSSNSRQRVRTLQCRSRPTWLRPRFIYRILTRPSSSDTCFAKSLPLAALPTRFQIGGQRPGIESLIALVAHGQKPPAFASFFPASLNDLHAQALYKDKEYVLQAMDTFSSPGAKEREKQASPAFSSFLAEDPAGSRRLQSAIVPTRRGNRPGPGTTPISPQEPPRRRFRPRQVLFGPRRCQDCPGTSP